MARILIVDDDEAVREYLLQAVRSLGHGAWGCSSGEEALSFIHDWRPDVVLTDYQLPGLNGVELAVKVNSQYHARVVLMSGGSDPARSAQELGMTFVRKPLGVEELKAVFGQEEEGA